MPWTLSYDLDHRTWPRYGQVESPCQISKSSQKLFRSKVIVRTHRQSTERQTDMGTADNEVHLATRSQLKTMKVDKRAKIWRQADYWLLRASERTNERTVVAVRCVPDCIIGCQSMWAARHPGHNGQGFDHWFHLHCITRCTDVGWRFSHTHANHVRERLFRLGSAKYLLLHYLHMYQEMFQMSTSCIDTCFKCYESYSCQLVGQLQMVFIQNVVSQCWPAVACN